MKRGLLVGLLLAGFSAQAQNTAKLVYDINPGSNDGAPCQFTGYNNQLYFTVDDGTHGAELWTYNGSSNPSLVYDLKSGNGSGGSTLFAGNNAPMALYNNKLYLEGSNAPGPGKVFVYDGVNPPTLAPGFSGFSGGLDPSFITSYGSKLYFFSEELYAYDGANAPVLYQVNPGPNAANPAELTPCNGKLVFRGKDDTHGDEVFVFDTTTTTVSLALDINPGTSGSFPVSFTVLNNKVYFAAKEATYGYELYVYDGTSTTRLTDLATGSANGLSNISGTIGAYNNQIYFAGSTDGVNFQLFRYNPANGNVALFYPFNKPAPYRQASDFVVYHSNLYFTVYNDTTGIEIWRTDGTNTTVAADICPAHCDSKPSQLYVWNNDLYFSATTAASGYELYRFRDTGISTAITAAPELNNSHARLYPNPAHGSATLEISQAIAASLSISLSDLSGKTVWKKELSTYPAGTTKIPLSVDGMSPGMYFFQVHDAAGASIATGKFLLE